MHVTTYTSFIDPNGNRTCATNMLCFGALHNNSPATLSIATPFSVLDFNDLGGRGSRNPPVVRPAISGGGLC